MPRGTARRRLSVARIQRILCQWERTVAAWLRSGARYRARPLCRCQGPRGTIRAAQQSRLTGTSWMPCDVNRCPRQRASSRPATAHGLFAGVHAARAARTFVRAVDRNEASARYGARRQGTPKPIWPGAAPGIASVANVRNETARHCVHDALPALGTARRLAAHRGPGRSDWGAGPADEPATRLPQARPHDVAGRTAHLAPAGKEKNGRRPHRCLQSGREVALRRP